MNETQEAPDYAAIVREDMAEMEAKRGLVSAELDAIAPDRLRSLVREAIDAHMEPWRLEQFRMVEREERNTLRQMFGGAA